MKRYDGQLNMTDTLAETSAAPAVTPPDGGVRQDAGCRVVAGPEGRMVGPFTLPAADGQQIRFRDYRQRRNLVVIFHHGRSCAACRRLLQHVAAHHSQFQAQQATVLAIGPDQGARAQELIGELHEAMPVLIDPTGRTAARAGFQVPALLVADRWGEIWAAWEGGATHTLPEVEELEEWLTVVQCDCT